MLAKEKRLRDTRDFKRVYTKGSFFGSGLFSMNSLKNRSDFSRLGIVVSKKTEPKATQRNLLKRRFRSVAAKLYDSLPKGYDIVVSIKPKAKNSEFSQIEKEIAEAFKKVGSFEKSNNRHN